ncbi:hypothetical protein C9I28_20285 [Pseudoduganella armeniaca]|uniref:Tle cognate immunity protein 4 C-terminal domain-containing protein n=1 Tax=Pseudoduganella armeniaca TaxID=2072590 RepID=A0A2R4CIL0_9BURK|nr:hypothetical protein C9I28_20285 [Pseudoduganella armeniaca]
MNRATFCVGRFLVDAPVGSRLSGGNYKYDFLALLPVTELSHHHFQELVAARQATLSAGKHNVEPSLLRAAVQSDEDTWVFAFWEEPFITAVINLEGFRWSNGKMIRVKDEVSRDRQEFGLNRMQEALSRLRARADTEIPTEPGYCFAGGFIANPRWRNEEATVEIDIAGHPDAYVTMTIYPLASHKKDKPLLERMGGLTAALANLAASVRVLRKGERRIGPYQGQEHLASIPDSTGARGHSFVWETQGDGTLDTPAIKIELTTGHPDSNGQPQRAALTDRQAIALWNEIVSSLRLRPTSS